MGDPFPEFNSPETVTKIRIAVTDLPEFEPHDYDGLDNDLWDGTAPHPDWRDGNLPHRHEANEWTHPCMLCGKEIKGWALSWSVPCFWPFEEGGDGFRWWRDVTIHLDASQCVSSSPPG